MCGGGGGGGGGGGLPGCVRSFTGWGTTIPAVVVVASCQKLHGIKLLHCLVLSFCAYFWGGERRIHHLGKPAATVQCSCQHIITEVLTTCPSPL